MASAGKRDLYKHGAKDLQTGVASNNAEPQRLPNPNRGQNKELLFPGCLALLLLPGMHRTGGSDKKTLSCCWKFSASPAETRAVPGDRQPRERKAKEGKCSVWKGFQPNVGLAGRKWTAH